MIASTTDGDLRLRGTIGDEYNGSSLDPARWSWGTWSGGSYTPSLSAGSLALSGSSGAYVRSSATYPVTTLEARAQFGAAPWQHLGWGSQDFSGDQYLLFSTFNGATNLYARSNLGSGEQRTNLGPLPSGFHTYRIARVGSEVRFFLDGALVATHTVSPLPALHVYQSHNSGSGAPPLLVDRIWVYPAYVASGSFESCVLNAGSTASWTTASWNADVPAGASLAIRTRTSADGVTWSAWSAPIAASGSPIPSPPGPFLQYRIELASDDPASSPSLESITLGNTGSANGTFSDGESIAGLTGDSFTIFIPTISSAAGGNVGPAARIRLEAERDADEWVLRWRGPERDAIQRYAVRAVSGAQRVTTLVEQPSGSSEYHVRIAAGAGDTFWVEGLDAAGRILARSDPAP